MSTAVPDVDLTPLNTLALPGQAERYLRITDAAQLATAGSDDHRFVLGGGSNLVLTGRFPGLILHMTIPGKRLLKEDVRAWYVEAGAGENWHDFVQWTLARGWPGLENLSLIPGTVGAAPVQNIGAYGVELAARFHSLTAWDFLKRRFFTVDRDGCRFAYRDSLFKREGWHLDGHVAIVSVVFRLPKAWSPEAGYADLAAELDARGIGSPSARDIAEAVISVRRRKLPDPAVIPNAGSFFHNPVVTADRAAALRSAHPALPTYDQAGGQVKLAAAWLIEQAGWKGRALGPVGMYEKQALVLVNHGGANGADVRRTMAAVQAAVREKFAVELIPEPIFL